MIFAYSSKFGRYCPCGAGDTHCHTVYGVGRHRWAGFDYCRFWGLYRFNAWIGRLRVGIWDNAEPDELYLLSVTWVAR